MFVTLHGSTSTTNIDGFSVVRIARDSSFPNGYSTQGYETILTAMNYRTVCVGANVNTCFRPTGIAFDDEGAIWVASDTTGEVIRVVSTGSGPDVNGVGLVADTQFPPYGGGLSVPDKLGLASGVVLVIGGALVVMLGFRYSARKRSRRAANDNTDKRREWSALESNPMVEVTANGQGADVDDLPMSPLKGQSFDEEEGGPLAGFLRDDDED
jgi:hypothetical protein